MKLNVNNNDSRHMKYSFTARQLLQKNEYQRRKPSYDPGQKSVTQPTDNTSDQQSSRYKVRRQSRQTISGNINPIIPNTNSGPRNLIQKLDKQPVRLNTEIITQTSKYQLHDLLQNRNQLIKTESRPTTSQQSQLKLSTTPEQPIKTSIRTLMSQVQTMTKSYYISELQRAVTGMDTYFNRLFRDHFNMSFYSLRQFNNQSIVARPKPIMLPTYKPQDIKKHTILFDLDETLVHCNLDLHLPADKKLTIQISPTEVLSVGVNIRPGLQALLDTLSIHFELIIFTASHGAYAKKVVEYIDTKRVFSQVLSREHCCLTNQGQYVKDLSAIKNRNLSNMVLVDNSAFCYFLQLDNGIPIIPFFDNRSDKQLPILTKYLTQMVNVDDCREYNRSKLKMYCMKTANTPEQAYEMIKNIK